VLHGRYISNDDALKALEEKDFGILEEYIDNRKRLDSREKPAVSFYTKDMGKVLEMVKLLLESDYEVLIYPEEGAFIVNGNVILQDFPRYELINWDEI